nr:sigma-70 family RNA polymerase sigma factor [Chitinophaga nivalis]
MEIIYSEHFPMVLRMILQHNGSEDDAKDIFQEAIIVLYEKVSKSDFTLSSRLKTFLYSVCRHLWLKKIQRTYGMYALSPEMEEVIPAAEELEEHTTRDQQFRIMEGAMSSMGEPCKTILEDYYLHKKSMQEIAVKFGYTNAENAKNQKYKCLMRLKKLFFEQYNTSL